MAACVQALLGTVILVALIAKLEDRDAFKRTLASLPWLRPSLAPLLSVGVPVAELAAVALLVAVPRLGAVAVLTLLTVFTAVVLIELLSGRSFACGCFGSVATSTVGPVTVARNLALISLAAVLLILPHDFEIAAALAGIGLAFIALVADLTLSTMTRERLA